MRRLFKIVALAMLVVAVTAGGAMAAGTLSGASKIIDYKMMTSDTLMLPSATSSLAVTFTTGSGTIAITDGATFNLVLTNASFGQSTAITMTGLTTTGGAAHFVSRSFNCVPTVMSKTALCTNTAGAAPISNDIGPGVALTVAPFDMVVKSGFVATDAVTLAVASVTPNTTEATTATALSLITADSTKTLTLTGTQDSLGRIIDTSNGRLTFTVSAAGSNKNAMTSLVWSNDATIKPNTARPGFKTTLTITGDFTGVSSVGWGANGSTSACTTSSCSTVLPAVTGDKNSTNTNLVFTVKGTSGWALSPRTFTISPSVTAQEERADPMTITPETSGMSMVWTSNGYSAIVPGLVYDSAGAYATSCTINNPGSSDTTVDVDLLNAYTGVTALGSTGSAGYYPAVVTVPTKKTARLTFGEIGYKGVKARVWGTSSEADPTLTEISTLGAYDRYSVKLTLTGSAASSSVTVSCTQKDPLGGSRTVPVLTTDSSSAKQ